MTVAAVPYIHISVPKLPPDQGVVITNREGDALRSSVWTPVCDPDEVAGTIHWIKTGLRGVWYVSFTFGGVLTNKEIDKPIFVVHDSQPDDFN